MGSDRRDEPDVLDLAVIGAGAAGTYVAERAQASYTCGEAFSRAQAWVEGALESADAVVGALV